MVGAVMRATAVALALTPVVVRAYLVGDVTSALVVQLVVFVASALLFAAERRDASLDGVICRTAGCGALVVGVWAVLGRARWDEAFIVGLGVLLFTPAWSVLLLVRSRTNGVIPQMLAGALTGFVVVAMREGVACDHRPVPFDWTASVLISGALAGVNVAIVERMLPGVDPHAPGPVARDRAWSAGALALFLLALFAAATFPVTARSTSWCCLAGMWGRRARDGLREIAARQAERARTGQAFAASAEELFGKNGPLPPEGMFRMARDEQTARWCAIADAEHPAYEPNVERLWINQEGVLYRALASEVRRLPLDPRLRSDQLPPGWEPVEIRTR